jgi:protein TonB
VIVVSRREADVDHVLTAPPEGLDKLLSDAIPERFSAGPSRLRPLWLRPLIVLIVIIAHIAPFLLHEPEPAVPPATNTIEVDMIAQGEELAQQQSAPELSKESSIDSALLTPQTPKPTIVAPDAPVTAPEAPVENPDAIVVPKAVEKPAPSPVPPPPLTAPPPVAVSPPPQPKPPDVQRVEPLKPPVKPPPKLAKPKKKKSDRVSVARRKALVRDKERFGEHSSSIGLRSGRASETGLSLATYRAILAQMVAAHTFTPPGATPGSIHVSFSIDAGGDVVGVSASGDGLLADAARKIVRSVHAPPPPGGHFHGSVTIRFHAE